MSNNQESHGTISFTKTGYSEVSKAMRDIFNAYQEKKYQIALRLHAKLKANPKLLKKNDSDDERINSLFPQPADLDFSYRTFRRVKSVEQSLTYSEKEEIHQILFRGKNGALCKPRQSDFKHLNNRQSSFTIDIGYDEAHISFSKDSSCITITVDRNNRSVDNAYNHELFSKLFSYLNSKYKWRKKEGGIIHYKDEYDEENHCGMSISKGEFFGPVAEQIREAELKGLAAFSRALR
ncbi:hypothetical protein [Vibrio owensii]|uniref:hypothetical protein n=1 Tax=Vibrio harveyi group TaxID=717610 RepID=UPI003CC61A28